MAVGDTVIKRLKYEETKNTYYQRFFPTQFTSRKFTEKE